MIMFRTFVLQLLNSEHVMSSFTRPCSGSSVSGWRDTEPSRINTIGLGDKMIITPAGAGVDIHMAQSGESGGVLVN